MQMRVLLSEFWYHKIIWPYYGKAIPLKNGRKPFIRGNYGTHAHNNIRGELNFFLNRFFAFVTQFRNIVQDHELSVAWNMTMPFQSYRYISLFFF